MKDAAYFIAILVVAVIVSDVPSALGAPGLERSFGSGARVSWMPGSTIQGGGPAQCGDSDSESDSDGDSNSDSDSGSCGGFTTCGDGIVDPSEDCDDGNIDDGDCCSSACRFETAGSACPDDGNPCTDNVCDGGGVCVAAANSNSCDDGVFCNGADSCLSGVCGVHEGNPCSARGECNDLCVETTRSCAADPAGTPCTDDGLFCTGPELCDGSGACVSQGNPALGSECNLCQEDTDSPFTPAGTPCTDDGLFCNGSESCDGNGACVSSGDPCSGEECHGCQEDLDTCVSPKFSPCTDDGSLCTDDFCDGEGLCTHPPIVLAPACNWIMVGASPARPVQARLRELADIDGSVCAATGDIGWNSITRGGADWVVTRSRGVAVRVRPTPSFECGSIITGSGCVQGAGGARLPETDCDGELCRSVCQSDGVVPFASCGVVDPSGIHPLVEECRRTAGQFADDAAFLDALPASRSVGHLRCGRGPLRQVVLEAESHLNIFEIDTLYLGTGCELLLDGAGLPDPVFILRINKSLRTSANAAVTLVNGTQASNVLFYVRSRKCDIGINNVGAGVLFCPFAKARIGGGPQAFWRGAILGGRSRVELGENAVLRHQPFLGLSF